MVGVFYPKGLKHSEYLAFYSEHFDTVEIDSTFYARLDVSDGADINIPDCFLFLGGAILQSSAAAEPK